MNRDECGLHCRKRVNHEDYKIYKLNNWVESRVKGKRRKKELEERGFWGISCQPCGFDSALMC